MNGEWRMRAGRKILTTIAIAIVAGAFGCAKQPKSDMLFVYSGDCQGYLEPCG